MPIRRTAFVKGGVYHLCNRGVNSQTIFEMPDDYFRFLDWIAECFVDSIIRILALCLLPNHFHLSIMLAEAVDLSEAMRDLQARYANYYNGKYRRHGYLFDGRFRSVAVESPLQLDYLSRYIHRNPMEAGLVHDALDWPYSSLRSYVSGNPFIVNLPAKHGSMSWTDRYSIPQIDSSVTLSRFYSREDYHEFVMSDWLRAPWILNEGLWVRPTEIMHF